MLHFLGFHEDSIAPPAATFLMILLRLLGRSGVWWMGNTTTGGSIRREKRQPHVRNVDSMRGRGSTWDKDCETRKWRIYWIFRRVNLSYGDKLSQENKNDVKTLVKITLSRGSKNVGLFGVFRT